MTETYWLPSNVIDFWSSEANHRFDLTGDHTGVTGVCQCGFVFTGVTRVEDLFALVKDHCAPIAADYLP